MKITILQGAFLPVPPLMGGAVEKMWFMLGKEFVRSGHEVTHISRLYKDLPAEETKDGVKHVRIKGYDTGASALVFKFNDLRYTWRARNVIPADTDVIITHTFLAPLVSKASIIKRMVVNVERMPKGQMRFYSKVARYRANSAPVADAIRAEIPANIHAKVKMIPNMLPFQLTETPQPADKKKVLLYVGRVHPEKGLDLLIKAFRTLDTDWTLNIVGPWKLETGGGGDAYHDQLVKLAGDRTVNFVGPVFDIAKLNEYYREASVFIYPSVAEKGETFGLAPLEAMAWGCAPVVSNLACFQDFIRDGKNGLIFDHRVPDAHLGLARQIRTLMDNAELRSNMAKAAIEVNTTHSLSAIADDFLSMFKQVAGK